MELHSFVRFPWLMRQVSVEQRQTALKLQVRYLPDSLYQTCPTQTGPCTGKIKYQAPTGLLQSPKLTLTNPNSGPDLFFFFGDRLYIVLEFAA